ncbi:MAG: homoserine dehydrogenase [Betaproteobacteria bacterium]|jgi:homoserine dehydrogenase|nr:homoserine dehydrogenase [Candidatus Binatia bacterium]
MAENRRRRVGVGLLGSGVVGEAIQDLLFRDLKGQIGNDIELEIRKIYTRNPKNKKWFSKYRGLFTQRAEDVLDDPKIDVIIEALGFQSAGQLGQYRDYILRAFENEKSVVTSDKAVLARYGKEIWAAAKKAGRELRFEACVGGGIPVIRSLTESFAVEEPEAVFGIVNGTCNYILSQMERAGKPYADALKEAQQKGYAETNPASDVNGSDAEAKLLLLSLVAFGLELQPGKIWRKGIEDIQAVDFRYARRIGGSTIKQLAVAKRKGQAVEVYVSPALISKDNFLAAVDGATNAVCFAGKSSGAARGERDSDYVLVGPGAGGGPTAVAVLGDVCELARGERRLGGVPSLVRTGTLKLQPQEQIAMPFYVRFVVKDRAGIVGDIGRTFGRIGVNISEIWQLRHVEDELHGLVEHSLLKQKPQEVLPFVMTLERTTLRQMRKALDSIRNRDYIVIDPVWFPIWGS